MISLIICTHGALSTGLLDAAQMIFGDTKDCYALPLTPDLGFEEYRNQVAELKERISETKRVVFLVDMYGATPFNTALSTLTEELDALVIYGINLPLLLELLALKSQSETATDFLEKLEATVIASQQSIGCSSVNQLLNG